LRLATFASHAPLPLSCDNVILDHRRKYTSLLFPHHHSNATLRVAFVQPVDQSPLGLLNSGILEDGPSLAQAAHLEHMSSPVCRAAQTQLPAGLHRPDLQTLMQRLAVRATVFPRFAVRWLPCGVEGPIVTSQHVGIEPLG
jgi:hypothetical protein